MRQSKLKRLHINLNIHIKKEQINNNHLADDPTVNFIKWCINGITPSTCCFCIVFFGHIWWSHTHNMPCVSCRITHVVPAGWHRLSATLYTCHLNCALAAYWQVLLRGVRWRTYTSSPKDSKHLYTKEKVQGTSLNILFSIYCICSAIKTTCSNLNPQ